MYEFFTNPSVYTFVRGPLVWIAFIIFIGGSIYKVRTLILLAKKEKVVFPYMSLKYSLRSILHWLIPFASRNWKRRPMMTIVTFAFHICLVFTPIFLLSHNTLWYESWGISWWTLSEGTADVMAMIVLFGCLFFFIRRIVAPEVKFVTFASDYILLTITFAPFLTGFLAYHELLLPYKIMLIIHMLAGETMLIAIPFTRLGHMLYFWLTRSFMGSQFGGWFQARDW
ncbi:MAG: nitrate reductase [Nitrospirota bacterium]|nr:nitrate reductase [Nitrospirota bacterium]MDH5769566.1 nitrate reductase [Nitrospirota bacterium]